jgi:lambda family phage minor tail protein L
MKSLSAALILEKNKLATPNPWIVLLDIKLPDDSMIYVARNTEDVVFNGHTYTAFPFEIEPTKESSKGEIPTVTLRVSNVTQIFQGYVEAQDGGIGSTATVRVVNAALLSESYAELEMVFDILATACDAYWISFTLGAPNPLRHAFPPQRYLASHCRWKFKSEECAYTGASTICKRTLDYCRQLGNSKRFGGFPGLSGGGVRLA